MNEKSTESAEKTRTVEVIMGNGFPMAAKKINRNALCECGSRKKAKKCCGTETRYAYSKLNEKQIEEKELKAKAAMDMID